MNQKVLLSATVMVATLVLSACSEAPPPAAKVETEAKKEPAKAPEAVPAQLAFYEMYKPARTWATDLLGDDPYGRGKLGTYQEISVDRDTELQVHVTSWRETEFRMQDEKGNRVDPDTAKITARRKDLDGGGRPEVLKLVNDRAALGPGRWEMSVVPPGGYYAVQLTGSYGVPDAQSGRADGWNEVFLRDWGAITIKLSSHPASIHGVVSGPGHDPAPGAPVYLEAFDKGTQKRLGELRTTRPDLRGQYHFNGLAPGLYRILGTFEYEKPDSDTMEAAGARALTLSDATDTTQDLDLYAP